MRLNVLNIAYPFAAVSAKTAGGAEQIVRVLDQALAATEHNSLVIACEGSETAGTLFAAPRCTSMEEQDKAWCRGRYQALIDHVLSSHRVDVIHMHGMDFAEYRVPATIPTVVTLHMPIAWYGPEAWKRAGGQTHFCCVSEHQRRTAPRELRGCSVVGNGVDVAVQSGTRPRRDFALAMGRICPEKNAAAALDAGTRAGMPVMLAGQVHPYREHREYFHHEITPRLQSRRNGTEHVWLGPLQAEERQRVMAEAQCLLHPTLAPETSSLVAMEALAAGTPVIAYRSGALTEIVEDGVTGFLVNDVEEMAQAIHRVQSLSADACRRSAERRFSKERMVVEYVRLYESLVTQKRGEKRYA